MGTKKIRVLHYVGSLNIGGSQTMLMELYRNIDRNKIQFDFIIDRKNELFFADEIRKLGGKIYVLPRYKLYNHFLYKKSLKNFFENHKEYKIIHGHVRSIASIYLKVAKQYNLKTICHSHSTSNGKGIKALIKKFLQYKIRYISDYFFSCSYNSSVWLFGKKIANSKRNFIINNSINVKEFSFNDKVRNQVRKELKINNNFSIAHVGRFCKIKNQKFIIEIYQQYLKENPKSLLFFIGDGEEFEEMKSLAKKLNIYSNIRFLGPRKDVARLLQGMDLFLLPSLFEGLPMSLVEAQASSLPCLISDKIIDGILNPNLVFKLSLNDSKEIWIDKINECKKIKRYDQSYKISEYGFDVVKNGKFLCDLYLSFVNEGNVHEK